MSDTLTIVSDGTGSLTTQSALTGEEHTALVWRHLAAGHMEIVAFQEGESPSYISDDMWEPIRYRADWQSVDTTEREPVLKNRARDNFWTLSGGLQLVGRA